MKIPRYPTTSEAKEIIQWLYSTETQYDETLEAGRNRVAAEKALLHWAVMTSRRYKKNPLDK
jgi:hypothetical protein